MKKILSLFLLVALGIITFNLEASRWRRRHRGWGSPYAGFGIGLGYYPYYGYGNYPYYGYYGRPGFGFSIGF